MATDVQRATVTDVSDPEDRGRVKLASARGIRGEAWAPVTTPAMPEVGDEVLVAFEGGDRVQPLVIGALRRDALELRFGGSSVVLGADGVVRIDDVSGNSVTLASSGITITAAAKLHVSAAQVQIDAGLLTVNAGMSKFAGVLQCETLIATSVVAANYSPGAGNAW